MPTRQQELAPMAGKMFHNSPFRQPFVDGRRRQSIDSQRSGRAPARVRSHSRCHQNSTWFEKRQARDLSKCWSLCVMNSDLSDVLVRACGRSENDRLKLDYKTLLRKTMPAWQIFASNLLPDRKFACNLTRLQDGLAQSVSASSVRICDSTWAAADR